MNHKIFTVHDAKAKAYLPPFYMPEVGMATRAITDCVNSNDHQFSKHPADYSLFQIGEFDDASGRIETCSPEYICNGVDVLDPEKPKQGSLKLSEADEAEIKHLESVK